MSALELLRRAAEIVESRRAAYGEPVDLFEQVAKRWSLTLGPRISPAQVVLCLLDLKLSRLARDPRHADSLLDLIGYAIVLQEVANTPIAVAEAAEVAEAQADQGVAAAEALLNRAEVDRRIR